MKKQIWKSSFLLEIHSQVDVFILTNGFWLESTVTSYENMLTWNELPMSLSTKEVFLHFLIRYMLKLVMWSTAVGRNECSLGSLRAKCKVWKQQCGHCSAKHSVYRAASCVLDSSTSHSEVLTCHWLFHKQHRVLYYWHAREQLEIAK